jgi:carboxypeptidase C (cathepsin A)
LNKYIGWKVIREKQPVVNKRGSLMGWTVEYEGGLSYFIINGAGHMVPADKPHTAYEMFRWFLAKAQ